MLAAAAKFTARPIACSKYKELVDKVHTALKTSIKAAQAETAHGMPLLSEILTAFEEEQETLKGFARKLWERAQKDRRQENSHNALLLAVRTNSNNRATVQPAQTPAPVFAALVYNAAPKRAPNFKGQACRRWDGQICHHEHELSHACKMAGTFLSKCHHM